jgi:hypothetical protein
VETVVAPNMDVVKRGVLIRSTRKFGNELGGMSAGRNLSQSSTLLIVTTGVVGTPKMVFTNMIMTFHVNKTANQPPMSSKATRGYKSVDLTNPRRGYGKPYVVIA